MNNIKTKSMCNICYNKIDAEIYQIDDSIYLKKYCKDHGEFNCKIENYGFFDKFPYKTDNLQTLFKNKNCNIYITDRCNLKCNHCYHLDSYNNDKSIDDILKICSISNSSQFNVLGGEPTIRTDFIDLINKMYETYKKKIGITTHGIKFQNEDFCKQVKDSSLQGIQLSLHHRHYLSERIYESKLKAIKNINKYKIPIYNVASTLNNLNELPEVIDEYLKLKDNVEGFRIRVPTVVGRKFNEKEIYFSDLINEFIKICEFKNLNYKLITDLYNNLYQCNFIVENKLFILTKGPSIETIDLNSLVNPFYSLAIPELGEIKLIPSILLRDALLKQTISLDKLYSWL